MASQNDPAAAASSSQQPNQPRPRLTMLQRAPSGIKAVLSDVEKVSVLAEANKCLAMMRQQRDVEGRFILDEQSTDVQPAHVAAAIALLCGYYTKKNGTLNPSAAADAFGHPTSRPAKVIDWMAKLERLEATLERAAEASHTSWQQPEVPSLRLLALHCIEEQRVQPSSDRAKRHAAWFDTAAEKGGLRRWHCEHPSQPSELRHYPQHLPLFAEQLALMHQTYCVKEGLFADAQAQHWLRREHHYVKYGVRNSEDTVARLHSHFHKYYDHLRAQIAEPVWCDGSAMAARAMVPVDSWAAIEARLAATMERCQAWRSASGRLHKRPRFIDYSYAESEIDQNNLQRQQPTPTLVFRGLHAWPSDDVFPC